jgi:hypothetical protein
MRKFTDQEIFERISKLPSFRGLPNGPMDVWIRSAADQFDVFDDKAFTYECYGPGKQPEFVRGRAGTTNAGSYYLVDHLADPRGCAVLKSDVLVYDSHRFGLHRNRKNHPAYVQNKGFPYFRDRNRNRRAEEAGPERQDLIGANIHHAGANSMFIKNWSAGCLVTANLSEFNNFMLHMKSRKYPLLTVCILKEWK